MEAGVEAVKAGDWGGALGNAVFKTGHGCYTHKWTATMVTSTRPAQDRACYIPAWEGEGQRRLHHCLRGLEINGCYGETELLFFSGRPWLNLVGHNGNGRWICWKKGSRGRCGRGIRQGKVVEDGQNTFYTCMKKKPTKTVGWKATCIPKPLCRLDFRPTRPMRPWASTSK